VFRNCNTSCERYEISVSRYSLEVKDAFRFGSRVCGNVCGFYRFCRSLPEALPEGWRLLPESRLLPKGRRLLPEEWWRMLPEERWPWLLPEERWRLLPEVGWLLQAVPEGRRLLPEGWPRLLPEERWCLLPKGRRLLPEGRRLLPKGSRLLPEVV
jgi:hypothetical protein